jgi:hypothetical protein
MIETVAEKATEKKAKEVIIEIDNTLEKQEIGKTDIENFNKSIINKSTSSNLKMVRDCIDGEYRHLGYLEYLGTAWNNHYGIVFTPDFFWQIFLTEIATHIKNNAEKYRDLFTDSDEKKEILVPTGDPQLIDLNLIAEELTKLVPTNSDIFLPEFSTTTIGSAMSFKAAFADAMSPYYNYSMFCCGIPSVKLLGRKSDWKAVISRVESFKKIIDNPEYFDKVSLLAETIKKSIKNPNPKFWKNIFALERCGSGGQVEVEGWINDLYMKKPNPGYIQNYPSSTSYVSYKNISTNKSFELCYGLFSSNVEGDYLVPEFGFVINEKLKS